MKNKKLKKVAILSIAVLLLTGCTTTLVDSKKQAVKNPETGQSLTENILCQPENEKTVKIYEKNKVNVKKLPKCDNFKVTSGGYEGLWTSIFVKPLAYIILKLGKLVSSFAISIIIITVILRFILFPFTKKMALQSEMMKQASPELERIRKKYEGKTDEASLMRQNQEMLMVYKKYNFNPLSSCLVSFIQLPLFLAFFEAINRVPAIFEDKFIGLQLGTTPLVGFGTSTFYIYIILIVLIGATTIYTFKMSGATSQDPSMKMMPVMMSVMIIFTALFMPSALGIYWVTQNLFMIVQNTITTKGAKK
ncbi:MAG: YidC/Oxa1 family membrane protein insertase [bacterium]|nr:YidC/Oxa1 family membrane protein insertase [bacterium]